jgi:DNA-binding MarR family transcriptional regulator
MKERVEVSPDFMLWVLMNQASDLLSRARNAELEKYSITERQAIILEIVSRLGNKASPTEIARWSLREPHSISNLLIRMEKQGLVCRTSNRDKKKKVDITLTEKGRKAFKESLKKESIHKIMSCLSGKEIQALTPLMQKIRDQALTEVKQTKDIPFP